MRTDDLAMTLTIGQLQDVIKDVLTTNSQQEKPQTDLMTRFEVMEYFQISAPTIQRWYKKGLIRKIKIGHKVYFNKSEILNFIG